MATSSLLHMRKGRTAASCLFLANGMIVGAWVLMIPAIKARLGIGESELGILILIFGVGALTFMPLTGALISRIGTLWPIRIFAVAASVSLMLMAFAPNPIAAAFLIFWVGGAVAGMDVAMNANVIDVESSMGTPIMSSCHGFWSLGGLVSAALGGFSMTHWGLWGHATLWCVIIFALVVTGLVLLEVLDGPDHEANHTHAPKTKILPRTLLPLMLGVIAFFSVVPEGVIIDWSALYLAQERGFLEANAGWGFAATSASMAVVRFLGDDIRARFGAAKTLVSCIVIAISGFVLIIVSEAQWLTLLGFFITGLGLSNIFPIAISAAGNVPNEHKGVAVSFVAAVGYCGILVAPPLFGFLAERFNYGLIFLVIPISLCVALLFIKPVHYADKVHS